MKSKRVEYALKFLKKDLSNHKEVKEKLIEKFDIPREKAQYVIGDIRRAVREGREGYDGFTLAPFVPKYLKPFKKEIPLEDYKPSNIITVSQMREKYSLPSVIKRYLLHLPENGIVTEAEMRSDIEITRWSDYKTVLELPEFDKYRGKIRSIIYWGHPRAIKDLKSDKTLKPIVY